MKYAKEIEHLLINLYCKAFGGSPDELEVLDGPYDNYTLRRKEDGLITTIPRDSVDLYLSANKLSRAEGKSRIIDVFQNFKQPIETDRGRERYSYDRPDAVYVKFKVEKGPEKGRVRVLNVFDSTKGGLALLITRKDSDLLEILDEGDRILDLTFFGMGARIKGDGRVKHMTKLKEGKFKGCYVLGVEAPDL